MEHRADQAKVTCCSKDRREKKISDALQWLAAMGSHVPERGQQCVRYYGAYANAFRGRQRKREAEESIPTVRQIFQGAPAAASYVPQDFVRLAYGRS